MTSLTLSDLEHDPILFKCAKGCERFSMPKSVAVERFGAREVLPEIARRLSCKDPEAFGSDKCVISYVELAKKRHID